MISHPLMFNADSSLFKNHHQIQWLESPSWHEEMPFIRHGFFARTGGVSQGPYTSLNMGYKRGDDLQKVRANYERVAGVFGLTYNPRSCVGLHQIHSDRVYYVDENWVGSSPAQIQGDGLITKRANVLIGVITADCVPVLLADPTVPMIGVVHAGWRGAAQGIVDRALALMVNQGASYKKIRALVGPAIQQVSYEVGREVYESFPSEIQKVCFQPTQPGHFLFDLPKAVTHQLAQYPLHSIQVFPHNTYTMEDMFFSCRRSSHQGTVFGNHFSGVMIQG